MKENKPTRQFVTIGEADKREALQRKNEAEIERLRPMAKKVRELKVRDFHKETPEIMERIAQKLDEGDFFGAKMFLEDNINNEYLNSRDYRDIEKAMGLRL